MKRTVDRFLRVVSPMLVFLFSFNALFSPVSYAQVAFLPPVGTLVNMTPKYEPLLVKGVKFFVDNPFKFEFIVDKGQENLSQEQIKDEGQKLSSYFLAALTTPEKEMWVNLSPFEKGRVIPKTFGDTEMGKEILAQDYVLKQIMATALYPENALGRSFWDKVYAEAAKRFGTTNVPINTFNKVWIVPNDAYVYENAKMNTVFVVKSSLKVMMERDYLAANRNKAMEQFGMSAMDNRDVSATSELSAQMIKEIVIPALEKEVNEGKNFAKLRQVYQALILASWYKNNLKDSLLGKGYVDRGKTLGVDTKDKAITQKIYAQYLKAYKKGVYNLVKEEVDPATNQMIPRKYFSGGVTWAMISAATKTASPAMVADFSEALMGEAEDRLLGIGVTTELPTEDLSVIPRTLDIRSGDLLDRFESHLTSMMDETGTPMPVGISNPVEAINSHPIVMVATLKLSDTIKDADLNSKTRGVLDRLKQEFNVNRVSDIGNDQLLGLATSREGVLLRRAILEIKYPDLFRKILGSQIPPEVAKTEKYFSVKDIGTMIRYIVAILPPPNETFQNMVQQWKQIFTGRPETSRGWSYAVAYAVALGLIIQPAAMMPANQAYAGTASVTTTGTNVTTGEDEVGGIDLEKINMFIKNNNSGIKTAFGNEKVLNLLLNAGGLFPQVQSIQPINATTISMYLS